MDFLTVVIFLILVLAAVGLWIVIGFLRYRSYFQRVRHLLVACGSPDIWYLPPDELADVDDVVRRCFFAKERLPAAAARVVETLHQRQ